MDKNDITNITKTKAILCAIFSKSEEKECYVSLGELEKLAETAECDCVGIVTQCRETPNVKTVLGSGKTAELSELSKTST